MSNHTASTVVCDHITSGCNVCEPAPAIGERVVDEDGYTDELADLFAGMSCAEVEFRALYG